MGCSSLDFLQLVDVVCETRVPHGAGILEAAPYHGDIGKLCEVVRTSSQVECDSYIVSKDISPEEELISDFNQIPW